MIAISLVTDSDVLWSSGDTSGASGIGSGSWAGGGGVESISLAISGASGRAGGGVIVSGRGRGLYVGSGGGVGRSLNSAGGTAAGGEVSWARECVERDANDPRKSTAERWSKDLCMDE